MGLQVPTLWSPHLSWGSQSLPLGGVQKPPSLILRHPFHLSGTEAFSRAVDVDSISLRITNLVTQVTQ